MPDIPTPKIIRSFRSSISMQLDRNGSLTVKAPRGLPMVLIQSYMKQHEDWILKHLQKIEAKKPLQKKYQEGEEFLYLGNTYKLKLVNDIQISLTTQNPSTPLRMRELNSLNFPNAMLFRAKKELQTWYVKRAKEKITERLLYHSKRMQADYSDLLFSDTTSKWGTCFPDNSLQFNWRLIMTPIVVLDYVVIHELAHTKEKNHGDRFWRIVAQHTPAYKAHRRWLHNNNHLLTF